MLSRKGPVPPKRAQDRRWKKRFKEWGPPQFKPMHPNGLVEKQAYGDDRHIEIVVAMASRMTRSKSVGGKGKAPMGASASGTAPRAVAGRPGPFTSPQNPKWYEKHCHNTLVFYANIEDKDRPKLKEIRSVVKGVLIYITRDYLARLLRVANEGEPDLGFKLNDALDRAGVKPSNRSGKWKIYTREFCIQNRLIIYFIGYNVMPRASSGMNEARYANVYFVDKMRVGLGIVQGVPLAPIMISSIRDVDEQVTQLTTIDVAIELTLSNIGCFKVQGVWRNPHTYPLRHGERPDDTMHPSEGIFEEDDVAMNDLSEGMSEDEDASEGNSLSRSQSTRPFIFAQPGPSNFGHSGRSSAFGQFFRHITSMCKSIEDTQTIIVDQQQQIIARQDLQQVQLDQIWETLHLAPSPGPLPL
ncbi:hypothetical protein Ancab_015444 [Ancistrocladus abbreviatus]